MVATSFAATETHRPLSADALRRFAGPMHGPVFWAALWAAAVAAELVALSSIVLADEPVAGFRALFRLVGGAFVACGLVAWRRRPDSRSGLLMVLAGFGLLVEPVFAHVDSPTLRFFGDILEDAWAIAMIALLLSFTSGGRLATRADRVLVGVIAAGTLAEVVRHFFLERDGNFLLARADAAIADGLLAFQGLCTIVGCLGVAVVIGVRFKRASTPARRGMLPSVAGVASLLFFAVAQTPTTPPPVQWLAVSSLLLVPAGFLGSLLRSRLARGGLTDLFGELRILRGSELQARLARATGDPSLVLAYRTAGTDDYADAHGDPVALPPAAGRAVTPLDGAALVYDAALEEDPALIEAVAVAATIALEHQQLQTDSQAARQRLVAAGDAERRRLERDLHDGAQQRLVTIAIQLRMIQADIRRDPEAAEALVKTAGQELAHSLEELRELARGLHPAVLDHGIASALTSLAARSAVPTAVSCDPLGQVPRPVELALYFVACEALANVGKYAGATAASIRVTRSGDAIAIEIADDGVGGAQAGGGSGLSGLRDRVEALAGHLRVTSPAGAGTVVTAEVPCAS